jgi:KTSC domain
MNERKANNPMVDPLQPEACARRASRPNWFAMSKLATFLISAFFLSLPVRAGVAQTLDNALRKLNTVRILVEGLSKNSSTCNFDKTTIVRSLTFPLSSAKFNLDQSTTTTLGEIELYVSVNTLYLNSLDYCVSDIELSARVDQYVKIDASGRTVFRAIQLWDSGHLVGSSLEDHRQQVSQSIEEMAKEFVTAWNLDNKPEDIQAENSRGGDWNSLADLPLVPASPDAKDPFADAPDAPRSTGDPPTQAQQWPGTPVAKQPVTNPFVDLPMAKPEAAAEPEVVNVKYRGPVSLAPFKCEAITRSSFIRRVCYDASNSYMLINLSGTWYHYCDIDHGRVDELLQANSMGRFYDASIKGSFDCRTGHVPAYQ